MDFTKAYDTLVFFTSGPLVDKSAKIACGVLRCQLPIEFPKARDALLTGLRRDMEQRNLNNRLYRSSR